DSTERGPGAAGCEAGARPPLMRKAFAPHDPPAGGAHRRPRAEEMIRRETESGRGLAARPVVVRASGSPDWAAIWLPRPQRGVERRNLARALRLLGTLVPDYRPSALV